MVINGVGFRWNTDRQVLEIMNRSCLIVKDSLLWVVKAKVNNAQ